MRLIKCHIENFGKLNNEDIDFQSTSGRADDGLVVINGKNGTGKTTLATFIKVMFFGFANEGKRSEVENERKRYTPWQGGIYGGQLTFAVGDKTYTINRTFGKKEKEDTFVLYDAATNLESHDYSEDIGEELLQIDHDSFLRTVFISQNDCATMSTDSINAKLGNLTDDTDDINNYEVVYRLLSDKLNGMSPTRKTGQIYRKKNEVSELRENIRKAESIDRTIQELIAKRDGEHERQKELEEKQSATQQKLQDMSKAKDAAAEKELYNKLSSQCDERQANYERERDYFPGRVPDEEELNSKIKEVARLQAENSSYIKLQLTDEERNEIDRLEHMFAGGVPDEAALADAGSKIKELSDMRLQMAKSELSDVDEERLQELSELFRDEIPDEHLIDEKINAWNKRTEKKNLLNTKLASVNTLRNVATKKMNEEKARNASEKSNALIIMIIGIVLMLVGIGSLVFKVASVGVVGLVVGVGFIIYSTSWRKRVAKRERVQAANENYQIDTAEVDRLLKEIKADEQFIQQTERDSREFFERYELIYEEIAVQNHLNYLRNKVDEYEKLLKRQERFETQELTKQYNELAEELESFLIRYMEPEQINEDNYGESLHRLERDMEAKDSLRERQRQMEAAKAAYENALSGIISYIHELAMEPEDNLQEQLLEIRRHYYEFKASEREYRMAMEQKGTFEEEHDMERLQGLSDMENEESMEVLNEKLKSLTEQIKLAQETISAYNKPLDKAYEDRERIAEDEIRLTEAEEELAKLTHNYEVMDMTRAYLEKAKESFTSKYMNPVMNGFEKYYQMMTGEAAMNYQIDANINLTATECGQQRDTRLLSTGYQNLTGICMRMGLLDAMYPDEKPFVIFDDPFVNLDSEKVEGGLNFLEKIAQEYQVIYFTCHDSRIRN